MDASLIERIASGAYRTAVHEGGWSQLLDVVRTGLDAKCAILFAPHRAAPALMVGPSDFTRHHRDSIVGMPDPWAERLEQLRLSRPTGGCRIGSSYLPLRDLRRSGYFDMVTEAEMQVGPLVTLYVEGDDSGSALPPTHLTVVRGPSAPDFGDDTVRLMRAIHEPLRAAVRNYWAFSRIRELERAAEIAYHALPQPVLVLRADGGIEYANAAADALLVQGELLRAAEGHLVRAGSYSSAKLALLVGAASRGMTQQVAICARTPAASPPAVLSLTQLPPETAFQDRWPRATVLATLQMPPSIEPADRVPALAQSFGFTRAEIDVLQELAAGATPSDIAQRRQVRVSTVRSQIRGLLGKSGCRRQADLVRLVLR